MTIYRVAQEALHNVLKHADATRIYVLSELRSDSLVLLVQDDGVGFEPMNRCRPSGSGLIGMNERAALAGGTLHVESSLGHGTTVFLRIPLERPAAWRRAVSRAIRSTASSTGLRERVGARAFGRERRAVRSGVRHSPSGEQHDSFGISESGPSRPADVR